MSEKVDAILESGCLEKLLEEGAPEIKDKEGMISYLAENGFTDLSEEELTTLQDEIKSIAEAEAALDESGAGKAKASQTCIVNFCDLRVKEAVAPLQVSEVKNELSEIAFFVKSLKD